jgi:hypothetical protein
MYRVGKYICNTLKPTNGSHINQLKQKSSPMYDLRCCCQKRTLEKSFWGRINNVVFLDLACGYTGYTIVIHQPILLWVTYFCLFCFMSEWFKKTRLLTLRLASAHHEKKHTPKQEHCAHSVYFYILIQNLQLTR